MAGRPWVRVWPSEATDLGPPDERQNHGRALQRQPHQAPGCRRGSWPKHLC